MSQSHVSHIVALICTAQNYTVNPNLVQDSVDFESLYQALNDVLLCDEYGVQLSLPQMYLDLKATSILRRRSPTGLHDHLIELNELLLRDQPSEGGVFSSSSSIELNGTLNQENHCPAVILIALRALPSSFLKWGNSRINSGLKVGTTTSAPTQGVFPNSCLLRLSEVFGGAVCFEQVFQFMPLDGKEYQQMLLRQIRAGLPEHKRIKFDASLEQLGKE